MLVERIELIGDGVMLHYTDLDETLENPPVRAIATELEGVTTLHNSYDRAVQELETSLVEPFINPKTELSAVDYKNIFNYGYQPID